MRIAIGSDHIGLDLKGTIIAALETDGHVLLDLGAFSAEPVDYPDCARIVGQAVLGGFVDCGMLVCHTAVGAAIAANKMRGIRGAPCLDPATARESRERQDANVLCLSAAGLRDHAAIDIARAWVSARFSGDDASARQVAKLAQLEAGLGPAKDAARPVPRSGATDLTPSDAEPKPAVAAAADGEPKPAVVAPSPALASTAPAIAADPQGATAPARPAHPLRDARELPVVEETLAFLESQDFLDRLWVKDASLWRGDAGAIRDRLGWLTSPTVMRGHVDELRAFADEIRRLQFSHVVLLGVGGAALSGLLFGEVFGSRMGFPDLVVVDAADPAAVKRGLDAAAPGRALFVVASKSGTTPETLAFYACARARLESAAQKPGMQFVAITDPGSPLERLATDVGFRRTFLNSPAIGARHSALSFFGLVPAALAGADIKGVLDRAQAMLEACGGGEGLRDNPGVRLGAALAALIRSGRDKLTLLLSDRVRALGPWIEQLLAGPLGAVTIIDEPIGNPVVYGSDRVFVALASQDDSEQDAALHALDEAGHPVIRIALDDPLDVGAELFRWQIAAATAGAALGVNPFDELDAEPGRERAAALVAGWKKTRRLPDWLPEAAEDGVEIMTRWAARPASVGEGLASHLAQAGADDHVAIHAYLPASADTWSRLQAVRVLLRDRLRVATTVGYGPRCLHSTGQIHKEGRPTGLFIQIVGDDKEDLAIPGAGHGFSTLKAAQALGDLEAMHAAGGRVIRLRLTGKPAQGLQQLLQIARTATRRL